MKTQTLGGKFQMKKKVPSLSNSEKSNRLSASPGSCEEPYSATNNLLIDSMLPV